MHRNKQIAIILPDTLQSIGLQSMLIDYFPPVEISHYPTFEAFSTSGNDTFDYYFTNAALFVLYADFFLPRRSKTMVLIDGTEGEGGLSATSHITIKASQEVIIEQLEQLFTGENNSISSDNNKELSTRETDVLQLIVKGSTNKEIADKLNISLNDTFDYYFTNAALFVLYADFFLPRRSKTMVLIDGTEGEGGLSATSHITIKASQEVIIEQLEQLFTGENNSISSDNNKELSTRETDVLQLIVKGSTNKEIADKLNISLNTVLSHRKNITTKLGIKTVSGLTFYAIMNGIISGDDIEL